MTRKPIVVVGAGAAGMATALAAAPAEVRVLCRDMDGPASRLAQGGIAAAVGAGDTPAAHAEDTIEAGAGHNEPAMVAWLTGQAPEVIDWLSGLGMPFDCDTHGQLLLGREGGHGVHRIVHAGGDASGAMLVCTLATALRRGGHVQRQVGVEVEALLLREGRVAGVRTRDTEGRTEVIEAAAVVLATGGVGALYARTSNPPGATGSGLALAQAAGAALRDMEMVQFHPTALAVAGQHLPLLTEALRGAGARLIDAAGNALMGGLHALGDLAPRDIVARRVWRAEREEGGAWLDTTPVAGDWERRFPTVLAACLAHGLDPRQAPLPVTAAAHFHMGGVAVDAEGQTQIPGLYAVGEVACNGVHGANRLASNSLLEAVACGRRLGHLLARMPVPRSSVAAAQTWAERGRGLCASDQAALPQLMWRIAGPVRHQPALLDACADGWLHEVDGWQARVARALLKAASQRKVSLGAHWLAVTAAMSCNGQVPEV